MIEPVHGGRQRVDPVERLLADMPARAFAQEIGIIPDDVDIGNGLTMEGAGRYR